MIEESTEWQEVAKLEKLERDGYYEVVYSETPHIVKDEHGYTSNLINSISQEQNWEWVEFTNGFKRIIEVKAKEKINKCSECGGTDLLIDSRKWYGLYCPFCEE